MSEKPVSYLQTDPRWANVSYSARGESTTIGRAGCGPTSMAMVLATWADKNVTPKTECAWALAHGYKAPHQGTYHSYFVPAAARYGLKCTQVNGSSIYGMASSPCHDTVKLAVARGDLVIACMGKGLWTSSGHYVVVWDIAGNVVCINDPASTRPERIRGNYSVFKTQVKYYWIIRAPQKKEEDKMSDTEIKNLITTTVRTEVNKVLPGIVLSVLDQIPKPIIYNTLEEVPDWGKDAVKRRLPSLEGNGAGLALSQDLLRVWVIQDREELREKAMGDYGMD